MIEEILDSEAKVRIMKILARFPQDQFQSIEIARRAGLSASRTSECLRYLADKGVLESRKIGKGYLFRMNKSNYLSTIILDLFNKEEKLVEVVARDFVSRIKRLDKIKSIVLFGSALKELKIGSDMDFLIVSKGEIDRAAVSNIGSELTEKYGFQVSSVLMTVRELKGKTRERFVINVIAEGKVVFGKSLEEVIYGKRS
jgi:predicted nucleotidyltransferase